MTAPIQAWLEDKDLQEYEKLVQDPVLIYTVFFCYQVHLHEGSFPGDKTLKKYCCNLLDITLRNLPGLSCVSSYGKSTEKEWLGKYTLGDSATLSMSSDPTKLEELYNQKGHLLVVLGDEKYNQAEPSEETSVQDRPATHRISQFANCGLPYSSFFEFLEKSSEKNLPSVTGDSTAQGAGAMESSDNEGDP